MAKKTALIFLCLASISALLGAYISQYVFGFEPCILCLYQRQPFFAIIGLSLVGLALFKLEKLQKIMFFLCVALLATNCAIAFYHVGVEHKIFRGPTTCSSANLNDLTNLEDLEAALIKTKAVRCDEPTFFFLGLTMAAWNFLYCGALIIFTALSQSQLRALLNFCRCRSNNQSTKR